MPSIIIRSKTKVAAEDCGLTINASHRLVAGLPSVKQYRMPSSSFPKNIDILLDLNFKLQLVLRGSVNGLSVSSRKFSSSAIAQNLLGKLRLNAPLLGLEHVSEIHLAEETDLPIVTLSTSSRQTSTAQRSTECVTLTAIDISFDWQIPSFQANGPDTTDRCPFEAELLLPYQLVLDNAVSKFMSWQIVKRYPLVFGPWCQQLETEGTYFLGLYRSIQSIIKRSPNDTFRRKCDQLLLRLREQQMTSFKTTRMSLVAYLQHVDLEKGDPVSEFPGSRSASPKLAFFHAMEKVYRDNMRQPLFKGSQQVPRADNTDDEALSQPQHEVSQTRVDASDDIHSGLEGLDDLSNQSSKHLFDHHFLLHSPPRSRASSPACSRPDRPSVLKNNDSWRDPDESGFRVSFSPYTEELELQTRPTSPMDDWFFGAAKPVLFPADTYLSPELVHNLIEEDRAPEHFSHPLFSAYLDGVDDLNLDEGLGHDGGSMGLEYESEANLEVGIEAGPQEMRSLTYWHNSIGLGSTDMLSDVNDSGDRQMRHPLIHSDPSVPYHISPYLEAQASDRLLGLPLDEDVDILSDVSSMVLSADSRNGGHLAQLSGGLVDIDGTDSHKFATLTVTRSFESSTSSQLRLWEEPEGEHQEGRVLSWDEDNSEHAASDIDDDPFLMDF